MPPVPYPLAYPELPQPPTHRQAIVNAFVYVHQTLYQANNRLLKRGGHTMAITPRHYLDFINHYVSTCMSYENIGTWVGMYWDREWVGMCWDREWVSFYWDRAWVGMYWDGAWVGMYWDGAWVSLYWDRAWVGMYWDRAWVGMY